MQRTQTQSAQAQRTTGWAWTEKFAYGFGDCAANVYVAIASTFITGYYTDTVALAAIAVDTMMLLAHIFDDATNLVMGAIVMSDWGLSVQGDMQQIIEQEDDMSQTSDMVRKNFKGSDDKRDAGLSTPPDVVRFDDIAYRQDDDQVLDVYRPRGAEWQRLAVIVSVHGGGWVYGDKERYQYYCMDLAQRGFAVVNFTYRLAPEHKFPASLEDTNSVFAWVLSNGDEYGFDAANVFAVGDSAGAHILALYAGLCTNSAFASRFPFTPPSGFVPKAIALNCGAYVIDLESQLTDDLTKSLMADLLPHGGTSDELDAINVLGCVTDKYPPVFLMTCTGDFLRDQAPLLRDKLDACGVPHVSRFYAAGEADLGHVFHLKIRDEAAKLCNDEECSFFERLARQTSEK